MMLSGLSICALIDERERSFIVESCVVIVVPETYENDDEVGGEEGERERESILKLVRYNLLIKKFS